KKLDDEFNSFQVNRIDFIKIDIEGSELYALQGGKETLKKFRPYVLIEINSPTYKAAGYSVADVKNFFDEIIYEPHHVDKLGNLVASKSLPDFGNVIFVPR
ncbi:MAG TPA: hypothetical protein DGG95_06995, partial [Cytophagales bacterium]|nr:hypothetical protein [Cytophagales bacterium]